MNFESPNEPLSHLEIKNEFGTVTAPDCLEKAKFLSDGFEQNFRKPDGSELVIRINPSELKKVLLTVNRTTLFKCMEGRFFTLAKVGDAHIPFYQSSSGTGGKTASVWHPYFGISKDNWIIKGGRDENGPYGMQEYHPAITEAQQLLNENFLLLNGQYYSAGGKIGTDRSSTDFEPQNVIFDINQHLGYKFWARDENYGADPANGERQMLVDHTGFNPSEILDPNIDESQKGRPTQWIKEILSKIE